MRAHSHALYASKPTQRKLEIHFGCAASSLSLRRSFFRKFFARCVSVESGSPHTGRSRVTFAFLAVLLDAWSRRVVGYAVSRQIDTRLTVVAL